MTRQDYPLSKQLAEVFDQVATLPDAEYRQFMAGCREVIADAQGTALLAQALGTDWSWPGDSDVGSQAGAV